MIRLLQIRLQDLQPEFHQLQADLETAQFTIKQHQAEAALFEDEKKMREKLDDERRAIEVEAENLRKSRDALKAQLLARNAKLWDEYVLHDGKKRAEQSPVTRGTGDEVSEPSNRLSSGGQETR